MINELRAQLAAGGTDTAILNWFVAKYGAIVLAAPIRGGFDNVAWIIPIAVFFLATVGVAFARLRSGRRRSLRLAPRPPAIPPLATDPRSPHPPRPHPTGDRILDEPLRRAPPHPRPARLYLLARAQPLPSRPTRPASTTSASARTPSTTTSATSTSSTSPANTPKQDYADPARRPRRRSRHASSPKWTPSPSVNLPALDKPTPGDPRSAASTTPASQTRVQT